MWRATLPPRMRKRHEVLKYPILVSKDEVLNAFFTSVFNRKASYPQDNQSPTGTRIPCNPGGSSW